MIEQSPAIPEAQAVSDAMWAWRRRALVMAYALLFALIAFYIGPALITNMLRYGHITGLQKEQLEQAIVQGRQTPQLVLAMRTFERDHGRLPTAMEELIPNYITSARAHGIYGATCRCIIPVFDHEVRYEFAPDIEGWYVSGPKFSGRFDMPLVPALTTNTLTTNSESP